MKSFSAASIARFWAKVEKTDECWLWRGALYLDNYGRVYINKRQYAAHKISHILTHGDIPNGMQVCHTCDNRACVRPDHLFLGTALENAQDRQKKGRGYKPISGRTRNNSSIEERFWRLVDRKLDNECWEWIGTTHNGYGRFYPTTGQKVFAHRFMWQLARGAIGKGIEVRHKCDNKLCVNPHHLELGTHADNMRDMVIRGRTHKRGKSTLMSKG